MAGVAEAPAVAGGAKAPVAIGGPEAAVGLADDALLGAVAAGGEAGGSLLQAVNVQAIITAMARTGCNLASRRKIMPPSYRRAHVRRDGTTQAVVESGG